jgi:hypothetical protein
MNPFYQETAKKWANLSICEQMANIGAEVDRALRFKEKNTHLSQAAFYRALELFDLTIGDKKNLKRLKEICRVKEIFAEFYLGNNQYNFDVDWFNRYFLWFNYKIRQ